jgi:hypothetical protein
MTHLNTFGVDVNGTVFVVQLVQQLISDADYLSEQHRIADLIFAMTANDLWDNAPVTIDDKKTYYSSN